MRIWNRLTLWFLSKEKYETLLAQHEMRKHSAEFFYRGNADFRMTKFDDALYDYTRAIEMNPLLRGAYINRGNVYFSIKRYQESISDYTKAIELSKHDAGLFYNRGCVYDLTGDTDLAIHDFERSIQLNKKKDAVYNALGICYAKKGNYKEAMKAFAKSIKMSPQNEMFLYNVIKAEIAFEKLEDAERDAKRLIELTPKSSIGYLQLAEINVHRKQYDSAFPYFLKAYELEPDREYLLVSLAFTLYMQEKFHEALSYVDTAIGKNGDLVQAQDLRAMILKKL